MKYNVYSFDNVLYRKHVKRDFYLFCFRKKPQIFRYTLIHFWYMLLCHFHLADKKKVYVSSFYYLKAFSDIESLVELFWKTYDVHLTSWYLLRQNKKTDVIMTDIPLFLIQPILNEIGVKHVIAGSLNPRTLAPEDVVDPIDRMNQLKKKTKKGEIDTFYGNGKEPIALFQLANESYIIRQKKPIPFSKRRWERPVNHFVRIFLMLLGLSIGLTFITLLISQKFFDLGEALKLCLEIDVFLLNFLPIFLILCFFYFLFNRIWVGFGITSILFFTFSLINHFKLSFRDDPFVFSDLGLAGEAAMMTSRYKIVISASMWLLFIGFIGLLVVLFFGSKKLKIKAKKIRFSLLGLAVLTSLILFGTVYQSKKINLACGPKTDDNLWSTTEDYQSHGFVYSFLYSMKSFHNPDEYEEVEAIQLLEQYTSEDIPENEKINVISIMLEAYQDFSKFGIDLDVDVYEPFHEIQEESYHGTLISNVFGAGTINTERSYLTGYYDFPEFNENTNSFVWYFQNQGYYTEGMHPVYGSFYDREAVNKRLGFQNYDFYENRFRDIQSEFLDDKDFIQVIIDGFNENKERNQPYFNFSTTYQNHGPYSAYPNENRYLTWKDGNDGSYYNVVNNYLDGVYQTNLALKELIENFKQEEEPVVIVLFSDHNPFMGENHDGYRNLGIDFNTSTINGFLNYYEIPYLIWGNEAAKEVTKRSFVGLAPTISPTYLMSELFEYLGWKGDSYLQLLTDLKKKIPVLHDPVYMENGSFTKTLSETAQKGLRDFKNAEYYDATHFQK